MAMGDTRLPEGTDSIIGGASVGNDLSDDTGGTTLGYDDAETPPARSSDAGSASAHAQSKLVDKAADLRGQAADKAREYATQGKDRAVEQLDTVQRMIGDAAATVESKVGEQYGAYIRQAADSVGSLSDLIRDKDVDQLLADARDLVRRSPGLAIGAAAAVGFVIARVAKAGLDTAPAGSVAGTTPTPSPAAGTTTAL
ncbi:MAG TPA: hypothetical protein VF649_05955 [Sphingomonas sp.]|jgi:ElaB/YqjD/DUF883 family membrane-anchored ribosome-binding protein|uniref:hypothetical protein n=1 Tax=Sphingomonas sp. TaxID=28214 RepID=UPI002EDA87C1